MQISRLWVLLCYFESLGAAALWNVELKSCQVNSNKKQNGMEAKLVNGNSISVKREADCTDEISTVKIQVTKFIKTTDKHRRMSWAHQNKEASYKSRSALTQWDRDTVAGASNRHREGYEGCPDCHSHSVWLQDYGVTDYGSSDVWSSAGRQVVQWFAVYVHSSLTFYSWLES